MSALGIACATDRSEVDVSERREAAHADYGRIVTADKIDVDNGHDYRGALIGARLGELAGSVDGSGAQAATPGVLDAIARGEAGTEAQATLRQEGWQYDIRTDDGEMITVIEVHEEPIRINERVRLIYEENGVRIEENGRVHVSER